MNRPVVLITGALTGIGRATALAFSRKGPASWFQAGMMMKAKGWLASSANLARKLNLCGPMCATRTMCAAWSIRPSALRSSGCGRQ